MGSEHWDKQKRSPGSTSRPISTLIKSCPLLFLFREEFFCREVSLYCNCQSCTENYGIIGSSWEVSKWPCFCLFDCVPGHFKGLSLEPEQYCVWSWEGEGDYRWQYFSFGLLRWHCSAVVLELQASPECLVGRSRPVLVGYCCCSCCRFWGKAFSFMLFFASNCRVLFFPPVQSVVFDDRCPCSIVWEQMSSLSPGNHLEGSPLAPWF